MIVDFMDRYGSKWVAAGLGIACIAVIAWMLNASTFSVDTVILDRDESSSPALLDEHALLTDLEWVKGQNVFRLNTAAITAQIESVPSVQWAFASVGIDGEVRVSISYRKPVANWTAGGKSFLVGRSAILLAEGHDRTLPLTIRDLGRTSAEVGDYVNPEALDAAYKLHQNLPIMGIEPATISYSATTGIVVRDASDREILFGPPEYLTAKFIALKAVLDDAARQGEELQQIDLRPMGRPTYRVRED